MRGGAGRRPSPADEPGDVFSLPSALMAEGGVLGPLSSGPTRPLQLRLDLGLPQPWVLCHQAPSSLHSAGAARSSSSFKVSGVSSWAGRDGAKAPPPPPKGRGQSGFCLSEAR